jgi:prevent-host-death family protein
MEATHISITEAKQKLGELVKRATYGGERFILEFRDKPQAAIVSVEDFARLEWSEETKEEIRKSRLEALAQLDDIRERVTNRGKGKSDSVRDLGELRDERTDHLAGLH